MHIEAIASCHNRSQQTLELLRTLKLAAQEANAEVHLTLYDDGSTDGTHRMVHGLYPDVTIIRGTGSEFWAKSMARAEKAALTRRDALYILWLNDDVSLRSDALVTALTTAAERPDCIVVGATTESDNDSTISYSAMTRSGPHPLSFRRLLPKGQATEADTFNGNFVLVPAHIAAALGGIDGEFAHALADIDYGMRARKAGFGVVLAGAPIGSCRRNQPIGRSSPLADWRSFTGTKGAGNPRSMFRYLLRHAGLKGIYFGLFSYLLWWAREISAYLKPSSNSSSQSSVSCE